MPAGTPATDPGAAAVEFAAALVGVDSVNPGLVPGAAGEASVVDLLRRRLAGSGFDTEVLCPPGRPDRPSLIAWSPGPAGAPTVLLNGHVDTVGVAGMPEPFAARIDGHRLLGRGACDMKGGVAGLVAAAEAVRARGIPLGVVLTLVADEEDASLGTEAILARLPALGLVPQVAVVAEPTWLANATSHRGYALVEVDLRGRGAHTSMPHEGVNALAHLGRLLVAVEEAAEAVAARGGALLASVGRGGSAPFTVPDTAQVVIERRTVPGEPSATALTEVQALLDRMRAADPSVDATARLSLAREAWALDPVGAGARLGSLVTDGLTRALADEPDLAPATDFAAPYWMESALLEAAGIPTLVCGPAGGGMHAVDEWVDLRQVRAYAVALADALGAYAAAHLDDPRGERPVPHPG
jgi:acetylornithine deacetylase